MSMRNVGLTDSRLFEARFLRARPLAPRLSIGGVLTLAAASASFAGCSSDGGASEVATPVLETMPPPTPAVPVPAATEGAASPVQAPGEVPTDPGLDPGLDPGTGLGTGLGGTVPTTPTGEAPEISPPVAPSATSEPGDGDTPPAEPPNEAMGGAGPEPEPEPVVPSAPTIEPYGYPEPLVAELGDVMFDSDFLEDGAPPDGLNFLQGTRWEVRDGVLHGQPSTEEYQAEREDHRGTEARMTFGLNRADVAVGYRLRILGGEPVGATFIELGHFAIRVRYGNQVDTTVYPEGAWRNSELRSDAVDVIETEDWSIEIGKWYSVMIESVGDELVIQVTPEGQPEPIVLRATHEFVSQGKDRIVFTGYRDGALELDNMMVWAAGR